MNTRKSITEAEAVLRKLKDISETERYIDHRSRARKPTYEKADRLLKENAVSAEASLATAAQISSNGLVDAVPHGRVASSCVCSVAEFKRQSA